MNEYWVILEWYWQFKMNNLGKNYTACVQDKWMSMEWCWNYPGKENELMREKIYTECLEDG